MINLTEFCIMFLKEKLLRNMDMHKSQEYLVVSKVLNLVKLGERSV